MVSERTVTDRLNTAWFPCDFYLHLAVAPYPPSLSSKPHPTRSTSKGILRELEEGTTLVCDRYAFSGIAFSAAKVRECRRRGMRGGGGRQQHRYCPVRPSTERRRVASQTTHSYASSFLPFPSFFCSTSHLESRQGLDYGWCKSPDVGLPAPDLTLFLSVSPEVAAQRGGFGAERYESSAMQSKVRELFKTIGHDVGPSKWRTVDAGQSIEAIEQEVYALASEACQTCPSSPIGELWK